MCNLHELITCKILCSSADFIADLYGGCLFNCKKASQLASAWTKQKWTGEAPKYWGSGNPGEMSTVTTRTELEITQRLTKSLTCLPPYEGQSVWGPLPQKSSHSCYPVREILALEIHRFEIRITLPHQLPGNHKYLQWEEQQTQLLVVATNTLA